MGRSLQLAIDDTATSRRCGTCNLCCTLQGVEELKKPLNVKCGFLDVMGRCSCYATRPESCRTYKCLWLKGYMAENMKPVISRAVMEHNATGDMLVMRVLPQDRDRVRRGALRDLIRNAGAQGFPVIVVCGEERTLFNAREQDVQLLVHNVGPDGVEVVEEVTYTHEVLK